MNGTGRPPQILERKEFKPGMSVEFRAEPDADERAKLFIHTAFFSGLPTHSSELRAALEFSSGGVVLCQH